MSERIDHVAEARVWLDNAIKAQTDRSSETVAGVYASIANTEATLALVEQQKVANLIALGQLWEDSGYGNLDSVTPELKSEIREALRL